MKHHPPQVSFPQLSSRLRIAALVLLLIALLIAPNPKAYYPLLITKFNDLQITMASQKGDDLERCTNTLNKMVQALTANCPVCQVISSKCDATIPTTLRKVSSGKSINDYSIKTQSVLISFSGNEPLASQACLESARQIPGGVCAPPAINTLASALAISTSYLNTQPEWARLRYVLLVSLGLSAFIALVIILTAPLHGRFSNDHVGSGPQKIHARATPRLGGLAVAAGLIAGFFYTKNQSPETALIVPLFLACALPAFLGGLAEDLTKRVGVIARLLLTMASGLTAALLIDAAVTRLDLPLLDLLLTTYPLLAALFTAFAVGGVANSLNIIDGFNGLSSGFSLLALAAFGVVAYQVNDQFLVSLSLVVAGSLLGFLFFNWPFGKLFLGDGGAYLIGFLVAEIGVLLVARNPSVSPWFTLSVLSYPIWETLNSIQRRGGRASMRTPDTHHMHHLVHYQLKRYFKNRFSPQTTHNLTAPALMAPIALVIGISTLAFGNTWAMVIMTVAIFFILSLTYKKIKVSLAHKN